MSTRPLPLKAFRLLLLLVAAAATARALLAGVACRELGVGYCARGLEHQDSSPSLHVKGTWGVFGLARVMKSTPDCRLFQSHHSQHLNKFIHHCQVYDVRGACVCCVHVCVAC